jgi:hypothetical protein
MVCFLWSPTTLSYNGPTVSFEPSITSKMLVATSTPRSVLATSASLPVSTPMGFIMVGCWYTPSLPATIASPSRTCWDHNFYGFASVGLLDSDEAWITLFRKKRTNIDVTIGSHLRVGLLNSDPLIRFTTAQDANLLPQPVLCVHLDTVSGPEQAIDPASSTYVTASPLSESVITSAEAAAAPTAPPWSPPPCPCCAICSPCASPAVEPHIPPSLGLDTPVSF